MMDSKADRQIPYRLGHDRDAYSQPRALYAIDNPTDPAPAFLDLRGGAWWDVAGRLQMRPGQVWTNVGDYRSGSLVQPSRPAPARQVVITGVVHRAGGHVLGRFTGVDPDPAGPRMRFIDAAMLASAYTLTSSKEASCRVCGCQEYSACAGSCWWVPDPAGIGELCSACGEFVDLDTRPLLDDLRGSAGRAAPSGLGVFGGGQW